MGRVELINDLVKYIESGEMADIEELLNDQPLNELKRLASSLRELLGHVVDAVSAEERRIFEENRTSSNSKVDPLDCSSCGGSTEETELMCEGKTGYRLCKECILLLKEIRTESDLSLDSPNPRGKGLICSYCNDQASLDLPKVLLTSPLVICPICIEDSIQHLSKYESE